MARSSQPEPPMTEGAGRRLSEVLWEEILALRLRRAEARFTPWMKVELTMAIVACQTAVAIPFARAGGGLEEVTLLAVGLAFGAFSAMTLSLSGTCDVEEIDRLLAEKERELGVVAAGAPPEGARPWKPEWPTLLRRLTPTALPLSLLLAVAGTSSLGWAAQLLLTATAGAVVAVIVRRTARLAGSRATRALPPTPDLDAIRDADRETRDALAKLPDGRDELARRVVAAAAEAARRRELLDELRAGIERVRARGAEAERVDVLAAEHARGLEALRRYERACTAIQTDALLLAALEKDGGEIDALDTESALLRAAADGMASARRSID